MEHKNYLGILLGRTKATVACLDSKGSDGRLLKAFEVRVDGLEGEGFAELAALIKEGCDVRKVHFEEVHVALDSTCYMQHSVHSEFKDIKQISATVRFDTEEVLTTDVSEVALAFRVIGETEHGSDLDVYTAEKALISDIVTSLQAVGIDPVTIEPDANCLGRYVLASHEMGADESPLLAAMSEGGKGYFLIPFESESGKKCLSRTFIVGEGSAVESSLSQQINLTAAMVSGRAKVSSVKLCSGGGLEKVELEAMKLPFSVERVNLLGRFGESEAAGDDIGGCVVAMACGAAMADSGKEPHMSFRSDFMAYQGGRRRLLKRVKVISVIATVLLVFLGGWTQVKLWQEMKPLRGLRERFESHWSLVMLGKEFPDRKLPSSELKNELNRVRDRKSGQISTSGEQSINAKLSTVLEAFNKCAAETKLEIKSISITEKDIRIDGTTAGRAETLKLFEALRATNLEVDQPRLETKSGRDNFTISARVKSRRR